MKIRPTLLLLVATVFLAGCTSIPLGFTKAEWKALTPEQQARYTSGDRNSFVSHITSARSDADTTVRNLNAGNYDSGFRDTSPGAAR